MVADAALRSAVQHNIGEYFNAVRGARYEPKFHMTTGSELAFGAMNLNQVENECFLFCSEF
eukprot:gene33726-63831_t